MFNQNQINNFFSNNNDDNKIIKSDNITKTLDNFLITPSNKVLEKQQVAEEPQMEEEQQVEAEKPNVEQELKKEEKEKKDKEELEQILEDQKIEELAEDFAKINERQELKKKQNELVLKMFQLLNYDIDDINELTNLTIQRDILMRKDIKQKLLNLIPQFKQVYKSSYLNCLHDNSIYKQKFPAINLVRQVLKCNHLALTPKIVSNGYEKVTGKKKVSRIFVIQKQMF